jgi:P-type Ca2+ transporter type 2C
MAHDETTDIMPAHRTPVQEVLARLGSNPTTGLSHDEARRRLASHGRNELPITPPVPGWRKFLAQFQSPLTILLLVATAISFVAWLIERESSIPFETITILAIVIFNAILGYVQEARAEQAVAALQAMASAQARVLRESDQHSIPSAELVPGDIILIEEGDTLPADGRLVEAIALRVAESALTGESSAVSKHTAPVEAEAGIGDQRNMIFSGTAVTTGRGRAVITGTGATTEIGKIAGTLQRTVEEATPLQKELDRIGKILGIVVIAIAVIMSLTIILISHVRSLSELVDVLLLAVSLAVAAVPEGLTAITTIVLSLGMQRMARRHVIVRKLSAVETLGSTTVICSDKTGTLTKNEMTVRTVVTARGRVDLTGIGYAPHGEIQQEGGAVTDEDLREEVRRRTAGGSRATRPRAR